MKKTCLGLIFLFVLMFSLNVNAAQYTFNIDFDNDPTDFELGETIIGSGIFIFETGVTENDGQYLLSELSTRSPYSFNFTFFEGTSSAISFTADDIISPSHHPYLTAPDEYDTWVDISDSGQTVHFIEYGNTSSPNGGALDFWNEDKGFILSFAGSALSNGYFLNDINSDDITFGNYGKTSAVPVPAAVWLFGSGVAGLALLRRKRS